MPAARRSARQPPAGVARREPLLDRYAVPGSWRNLAILHSPPAVCICRRRRCGPSCARSRLCSASHCSMAPDLRRNSFPKRLTCSCARSVRQGRGDERSTDCRDPRSDRGWSMLISTQTSGSPDGGWKRRSKTAGSRCALTAARPAVRRSRLRQPSRRRPPARCRCSTRPRRWRGTVSRGQSHPGCRRAAAARWCTAC